MPPISRDFAPGWIFGIARSGDLLLIVLDLKKDTLSQFETVHELLNNARKKPQTKTSDVSRKKGLEPSSKVTPKKTDKNNSEAEEITWQKDNIS